MREANIRGAVWRSETRPKPGTMAATALRRQARLGKMVGGFFQHLFCPLVETLSRKLSSKSCSAMDFGSDTKHHLPRIRSLRLFADFPAGLEVVIDGLMGKAFLSSATLSP